MTHGENGLRRKGEAWNESTTAQDPVTGRLVRKLTAAGYNEKPTYHTNTAFTADGEYLAFVSGRGEHTALFKAHLASGEITQLTAPVQGLISRMGDGRMCMRWRLTE